MIPLGDEGVRGLHYSGGQKEGRRGLPPEGKAGAGRDVNGQTGWRVLYDQRRVTIGIIIT